jgi:hypothetical protein
VREVRVRSIRQAPTASATRAGRGVLLAAIVVAALLLGAACGSDDDTSAPSLSDPSQTGQELVEKYMSLLEARDVDGLGDFLSDAFLRQGAEGRFATKEDYLGDLPQISNYTIAEVTAQQDGDALVVRWLFTVEETIDGQELRTEPSPRLATFVWRNDDWRLLSHANFNPPSE